MFKTIYYIGNKKDLRTDNQHILSGKKRLHEENNVK